MWFQNPIYQAALPVSFLGSSRRRRDGAFSSRGALPANLI
jgi:hypothetical protein